MDIVSGGGKVSMSFGATKFVVLFLAQTPAFDFHFDRRKLMAQRRRRRRRMMMMWDGCQVAPGFTLSKVFTLTPLLANNKDKWGLALDGQLKHEDTNLASSTLIADPSQRENLGIIVQYKVKVKLCITPLGGDLVAELPFILMHPKPDDDEPVIGDRSPGRTVNSADRKHSYPAGHDAGSNSNNGDANAAKEDGPNLIQLDGDDNGPDDDIIFEDFARLRLKGAETEA
ncbi:hypothetical protein AND_000394 [Anopheles darlingi]|uniref:Arrestin C-terminal-like domain-containing protein n=1 Tax=Anopheles darlingi TaxID=43151 RepID=W5JUF2_ANODA|nr:hypothetical protein AND_000394 [Anopheles darlingi]